MVTVLADYLQSKQYFPFNTLKFELFDLSSKNFEQVKRIFNALEHYPQIERIHFMIGEKGNTDLTTEQYQELLAIFSKKSLTVLLMVEQPRWEKFNLTAPTVSARQDLMNIIATNRRNKNIERRKTKQPPAVIAEVEENPTKRTNIKRAVKLANFDVKQLVGFDITVEQQVEKQYQQQTELQQEIQQEAQIQEQEQNEIGSDISGTGANRLIDRATFKKHSEQHMRSLYQSLHTQCPIVMDKPVDAEKFWDMWVGGQSALPKSIKYFTPEAIAKVEALPQYFFGGINFDNLPTGFFIQQYLDKVDPTKNGFVLCYDITKFVENKNRSPLTPILKIYPGDLQERWLGDLRQFDVKETDNDKILSFNGLINDGVMTGQAKPTIATLIDMMKNLNISLTEEILKNHAWCLNSADDSTDKNIVFSNKDECFALHGLLYCEGCEGIQVFLDALRKLYVKDKDLYLHFKKNFINGLKSRSKNTIMELISDKNLGIIAKLGDLSESQKIWWKRIVDAQIDSVGHLDLEQLYDGFMFFLNKLPHNITLPSTCPIAPHAAESRVSIDSSLPIQVLFRAATFAQPLVALDRLLAILGKIPSRNLADQMENLMGLDFSLSGAWYATRWDGFHYVHPKMQLDIDGFSSLSANCKVKNYRVDYRQLRSLADQPYQIAETMFHRYLGRCEVLGVPYANYVNLTKELGELKNVEWSIKIKLLPLLAIATTGKRGSREFDSTELFAYVAQHSKDQDFEIKLDQIADNLEKLTDDKPTLAELTGLIKLVHGNEVPKKAVADEKDLTKDNTPAAILMNDATEKTLLSWSTWARHDNGLHPTRFLTLFAMLKEANPE